MQRLRMASRIVASGKRKKQSAKKDTSRKPAIDAAGPSVPQPTTTQLAATNLPPNVEVYNIKIQQDFEKKALLPPIAVWNRVVDRNSFLIATLRVFIKRKGLFFDRLLASGYYTCIMSKQGHLVIYTQHPSNEGYATNLRKATRINFKFLLNGTSSANNSKKNSQENSKRTCKVKAQWRFGSVAFCLPESKVADWCCAIFGATCDPIHQTRRLFPIQSEPQSSIVEPDCEAGGSKQTREAEISETESDHETKAEPSDHSSQSLDNTSDGDSMSDANEEEKPSEGETLPGPENADSSSAGTEPNVDTPELPETQEGSLSSPSSMDSDRTQHEEEDGQKEDPDLENNDAESCCTTSNTLRRRVTFSDLQQVFMVPSKTAEEMGEEEGNTSAGCCIIPPVLSLVGKAFNGDAKDDETMEERKKEQIVQSALDQMRIVGQHGSTGTLDDGNDKLEDEDSATNEPAQYPPQAERFDRTRHFFEPGSAADRNGAEGPENKQCQD